MKKCIFHYPGPLRENPTVGSEVRPVKMLQAFKDLGYEVELITGYSNARKNQIEQVKRNIRKGVRYDFVYAESTTMPTALSDNDHLPRNPFLDERFFSYCRKNGIPVGLFYRDAYWQFPYYKERVARWIPYVTIPFYKHELGRYRSCVDTLFVPSEEFANAIEFKGRYKELPSGGDLEPVKKKSQTDEINLFYVGGVVGINDIELVVDTVKDIDHVSFTLCCPEDQWCESEATREIAEKSLNIHVIHKKGREMKEWLKKSDIAMAYYERNPYRDLAMPVKLFEYICCGKPVITTADTAAGRYVQEKDIGWAVDFDAEVFRKMLMRLAESRDEIREKTENTVAIIPDNTWEARARTVADDLKKGE